MIPLSAFARFSVREHAQAARLKKGLRGYHQQVYDRPEREIRRLGRRRAGELGAQNPYAREYWMRSLGAGLCREVGAQAPDWVPRVPVFFVTLIDEDQIVYPADCTRGYRPNPEIADIRRYYRRALRGLDYLGMLDPTLYVSAQQVQGVPRFLLWHAHALVWNISKGALDLWAESVRPTMSAYLPYASAVDCRQVRPRDLRQLIWYTNKTPYKQYQVWRRETGSLGQQKRNINGVNSVRLYADMKDLVLPRLTLAGGAGRPILRQAVEASAAW
ncbi:hypothetical protein [Methylobacterium aquaticum]|nr:hypothetical protein [Methylobacterium aquaticum]